MAYTTAAKVKAYLVITSAGDDSIITDMVSAAQQAIDNACGRSFEASADTTRRFDMPEDMQLLFDQDLAQLASVVNGDGETLTLNSDFVTLPRNHAPYYGIELMLGGDAAWAYTTTPERAIVVTGRWAFSLTAPADIEQAALRLAAWMYMHRTSYQEVQSSHSSDSGALIVPSGWPKEVVTTLERYKRRNP